MAENISQNSANNHSLLNCESYICHFTASERVGICIAIFVLFFISLISSGLICHLFLKNSKLRSCTNISIFHLAITDILTTVFCLPVISLDLYILDEWLIGDAMCKIVSYIQNVAVSASMLTLMAISLEKFLVICFPLLIKIKRNSIITAAVIVWTISLLESTAPLFVKEAIILENGKSFCVEQWHGEHYEVYVIFHSVITYFLPLALMLILHSITVVTLWKSNNIKLRGGNNDDEQSSTCSQPRMSVSGKSKKFKAMRLLIVITTSFAIGLTPYHVVSLLFTFKSDIITLDRLQTLYPICIWMWFFSTSSHPFIYGFASRKYRRALKKSFRSATLKSNVDKVQASSLKDFHATKV